MWHSRKLILRRTFSLTLTWIASSRNKICVDFSPVTSSEFFRISNEFSKIFIKLGQRSDPIIFCVICAQRQRHQCNTHRKFASVTSDTNSSKDLVANESKFRHFARGEAVSPSISKLSGFRAAHAGIFVAIAGPTKFSMMKRSKAAQAQSDNGFNIFH